MVDIAKRVLVFMSWKDLNHSKQLDELLDESHDKPVAIFKHSSRCGISHMVQDELKSQWDIRPEDVSFYHLSLIERRDVSNHVADKLRVPHQSPQLMLLKRGEVVYNASHHSINLRDLKRHI